MKTAILIGTLAIVLLNGCSNTKHPPITVSASEPVPIAEIVDEVTEIEPVETITFRVTAYCACEKCCGKWAKLRPRDSYGDPIIMGAAGTVLATGISCASPYPFGTEINLDGFGTVIVEDRTAQWVVDKYGENIIDIYFDNHQTAKEFGVKYIEGVVWNDSPSRSSRDS